MSNKRARKRRHRRRKGAATGPNYSGLCAPRPPTRDEIAAMLRELVDEHGCFDCVTCARRCTPDELACGVWVRPSGAMSLYATCSACLELAETDPSAHLQLYEDAEFRIVVAQAQGFTRRAIWIEP
jgi:hypothetical protein